MNLPNRLTILRVLMVPVFIACFYIPVSFAYGIAAVVFLAAYTTDALDGYLARKRNIVTDFGKLMDPIADKLLSCSAFIMLVAEGLMHPVAAIIIISREFMVSGLRLVMAGRGSVMAASWLGKAKTVLQFFAVILILLWPLLGMPAFRLDSIVLVACLIFTIWSGLDYIVKNKDKMGL